MGKYIDVDTDDDLIDQILRNHREKPARSRETERKPFVIPPPLDPRLTKGYVLDDNKNPVSVIEPVKEPTVARPERMGGPLNDDALSDIDYMQRCIVFDKQVDPATTLGYARVSTKRQVLENQIQIFRQLGVNVVFADKMSGTKYKAMERPDFRRMIEFLDINPQYTTLLVYEISRLGRNMLDSITTFSELEGERNIRVYSLTEPWTHSIDEDNRPLMISIFSWMNEMESKRISRRTKAGQLRAVREGKKLGKPISVSDEKRQLIEDLRERGWTWDEIAHHKEVNCNESTLRRTRERWRRQDLGQE
ncbi:MAG: recombinase family protein [candidate division Zixibacteria bacterium]|jgi:DNA invertase Pin-like site-specific DNA recombinase|nr:recombinase family protein [candidate division Zixibacteria bacterium]